MSQGSVNNNHHFALQDLQDNASNLSEILTLIGITRLKEMRGHKLATLKLPHNNCIILNDNGCDGHIIRTNFRFLMIHA